MIYEAITITITCDRKGCANMNRVQAADTTAANLILYKMGWRFCTRRGKDLQLCPIHAARETRRLSQKS